MSDYSNLTDDQLDKKIAAAHDKLISESKGNSEYSHLSDEELNARLKKASEPKVESLKSGLIRGTIDAIPYATGLAGGVAGSALGPIGTAAGGGLGYAAGRELQDLANHYVRGEALPDNSPMAQAGRVAENVAIGSIPVIAGPAGSATKQASSALARKAVSRFNSLPGLAKDALAYGAGYSYDRLSGKESPESTTGTGVQAALFRRLIARRRF